MTALDRPRKVCITGALGFIGRRLAERLRAHGAGVKGVDMRAEPALDVVAGDITEAGAWQEAFAGADLVIHAAAVLGARSPACSPPRPPRRLGRPRAPRARPECRADPPRPPLRALSALR